MVTKEELKATAKEHKLESHVVSWTDVGTEVFGQVAAIRKTNTKFGPQEVAMIIDPETGERQDVFLTIVLQEAFTERGVKVGDIVYIQYLGEEERVKRFAIEVQVGEPIPY